MATEPQARLKSARLEPKSGAGRNSPAGLGDWQLVLVYEATDQGQIGKLLEEGDNGNT
jgi:hypothetical protein